jgi:hypothetical protein
MILVRDVRYMNCCLLTCTSNTCTMYLHLPRSKHRLASAVAYSPTTQEYVHDGLYVVDLFVGRRPTRVLSRFLEPQY